MSIYTDIPWFSTPYSPQQKRQLLGALKSLITYEVADDAPVVCMIEKIGEILFDCTVRYSALESLNLTRYVDACDEYHRYDVLALAILVALAQTEQVHERLQVLLDQWGHYFRVDKRVEEILRAFLRNDYPFIQRPNVLGEAYQNSAARENGIKTVGWFDYKRQMKVMKKGGEYLPLKEKYDFLNHLPKNTLGGQLCALLRSAKLSLPGESHGFPEFFLWHDLSHLLSGNGTNYPGELGTNAFTAAYSKKGKYKILLFGLLQFNMGVPLAIVAQTAKNKFNKPAVIEQYLSSLLTGCETTLDPLDWPISVMIDDMKMDLAAVRRKYNIHIHFD